MDVLYRMGKATAAEIRSAIPDAPSYSAIRATLRILESKSHVLHEEKDLRYVFMPVVTREKAQRSALRHLLDTFFEGSTEQAVATLLNASDRDLSQAELDCLAELIEKARQAGR